MGPIVTKYCWIMSTFTLPRYYEGVPGQDVMYHGVGKLRTSYIIYSTSKIEFNESSIN